MKRRRTDTRAWMVFALASIASCTRSEESGEAAVVARLGFREITAAELVLAAHRGFEETRAQRLERAIGTALLAQEARAQGVADEPEVRARIALARARAALEEDGLLAQALFERERTSAVPDEAELAAHYERTKGRYLVRTMELRARRFASRADAEAVHGRLGASGRLDPAQAEAIGPTEIQKLPRFVMPEALGLHTPGERVIAGSALEGYSLLELVEHRPAAPRPLAEVREQIARELATQGALAAMDERAAELRKRADVEIDPAALAADASFEALERAADSPARPARRRARGTRPGQAAE